MEYELNQIELVKMILQILRCLGKDDDTTLYLFDTKAHYAYFCEATAKLFGIPELVKDMPQSIMKRDFMLPESQEEFIRLHNLVSEGATEAKGTIKLKNTNGIDTIYELKLERVLTEDGKKTDVVIGKFKEVTQRYIKDLNLEQYNKVLTAGKKFPVVYNKKKDSLKITFPDENTGNYTNRNFFFYSKMVKDEQICGKNDIGILLDYLNNGTDRPIQIEMFDQITEEYRWYALTGKLLQDNPNEMHGIAEDITDLKYGTQNADRIRKIFNIVSNDYLALVDIDVINDTYDALLGDFSKLKFVFPTSGKYSSANEYISQCANEEYKAGRLAFGSLDNIKEQLKTKNKIVFKYKTADPDYPLRKAVISRIDLGESEEVTNAFLSILIIDNDEFENTVSLADMEASPLKKKVLVVDDFELNAKLAMDSIRIAGFDADWAANSAEALGKLETAVIPYSLIFLDDRLGKESGFDAAKNIRSMEGDRANTPIVLYSLKDSKSLDGDCESYGINAHTAKPLAAMQVKYLSEKLGV